MIISKFYQVPDIFVVGAAKSGTTAIWKYLQQHPELHLTSEIGDKELGYFCNEYGIKKLEDYAIHFDSDEEKLKIEVCHSYLSSPESAAWIKSEVPNAKIIAVLRNPTDRAYSLYNWMVMHGYEYRSFKECLKREKRILKNPLIVKNKFYHEYYRNYLYAHSGLYADQVARYIQEFGKNFRIFLYDDLSVSPAKQMSEIFSFLGVEDLSDRINYNYVNSSKKVISRGFNYFAHNYITHYGQYLKIPRYKLEKAKRWFVGRSVKNKKPASIDPEIRKNLSIFFLDDIIKLEKIIGLDLSKWKNNE